MLFVAGLQFLLAGAQFLLTNLQFLIAGFQFLLAGLQFLLTGAQFLLAGFQSFLTGFQLLLAGLQVVDPGFQALLTGAQFLLACLQLLLAGAQFLLAGLQLLLAGLQVVDPGFQALLAGAQFSLAGLQPGYVGAYFGLAVFDGFEPLVNRFFVVGHRNSPRGIEPIIPDEASGVYAVDAAEVAAALKFGGQPDVHDGAGGFPGYQALADGEDIGVVVLASVASGCGVPAEGAADAGDPVGDDGLAVAGTAQDDAPLRIAPCYGLGHRANPEGVIGGLIGIGAVVNGIVAQVGQQGKQPGLVLKSGVVGTDGNFHNHTLLAPA